MASTYLRGGQDAMSRLSNELLLSIFEQNLPTAVLAACALSCKKWNIVATTVLYKHVVLTSTQKFAAWSNAAPPSLDATTETLTICITEIQTSSGMKSPELTMGQLQGSLASLEARISRMLKVVSLSITTPKKLSNGLCIPNPLLVKVLDRIPSMCSSLELVIRSGLYHASSEGEESHLCPAIRRLLPRLRYVRLALPSLCPESFGCVSTEPPTSKPTFTAIDLPKLRECIVILASPKLGNRAERFDKACNPQCTLAGMTAVVESLVVTANSGKAPVIEKLWVYDSLSSLDDEGYSYGAFVRRDVLANKSYTFPWNDIAPLKRADSFLIRMPEDEGGEDMLTTRDNASCLVERHAWQTAVNGTRLPAALMKRFELCEQDFPEQTRAQWSASSPISSALWKNENDTGMRLLDGEVGDLLEDRPAVLRIPEGWQRGFMGFLKKIE